MNRISKIVALTALIGFVFGTAVIGNAVAGQKVKLRNVWYGTKWEQLESGYEEGHIVAINAVKGITNNMEGKALFDGMWPGVLPTFPGSTAAYGVRNNRLGDLLNYAKSYLPIAGSGSTRYIKDHFEIYHVVGDPTLESRIYSAITGKETSEEELSRIGERIYNLQRAIQLRHGWGGRDGDRILEYFFTHPLKQGEALFNPDGIMPGPDGQIISRLGKVLDRSKFEEMLTEYYQLRGWDTATGFPTTARLLELDLDDVISGLSKL